MTDNIYLERCANLYTLIRSIPPKKAKKTGFNMESWAANDDNAECGTSACMAGHAGIHPYFVNQGFNLVITPDVYDGSRIWTSEIEFAAYTSFTACVKFFDINKHVFDPFYNNGNAKTCAAYLRREMEKKWGKKAVRGAVKESKTVYKKPNIKACYR